MTAPPPPPPAPIERLSLVGALAIIGVGLVGAVVLPGESAGVNVTLTSAALGAAALGARGWDLTAWGVITGGLAVGLASMFTLHTSEWVLAVDIVVAGGLGVLALTRARDWAGVLVRPPAMLLGLPRGLGRVVAPVLHRSAPTRWRSFEPAVRGALLTIFLVGIFGGLFMSADEAFARIAEETLIPDWDLGLLPARVIVGLLIVGLAGAYVAVPVAVASDAAIDPRPAYRDGLGRVEVVMALGALNLLFAGFVAVQVSVLFGGRDHVSETAGLSYAEYAREGFFQLVVVAFLTLAVIAATLWLTDRRGAADKRLLKGLLGGLCVLTLVILASAWMRLSLYEDAYGFTRLRLGVHTTIIWLALLFALVITAGVAWNGRWLPRAVALVSVAVLLGLNILGPDAFVAERNVARFEQSGRFDAAYASTLGADAVPSLVGLPEPQRSCAVAPIAARLEARPQSWVSFNFSDHRARELLEEAAPPDPQPASCAGEAWD